MKKEYAIQNMKGLIVTLAIILFMYLFIESVSFSLFILLIITLMGMVNGIFWFYTLTKNKYEKIIVIVVIAFTWPILSLVGSLTLVPIIVFDIIYIIVSQVLKYK